MDSHFWLGHFGSRQNNVPNGIAHQNSAPRARHQIHNHVCDLSILITQCHHCRGIHSPRFPPSPLTMGIGDPFPAMLKACSPRQPIAKAIGTQSAMRDALKGQGSVPCRSRPRHVRHDDCRSQVGPRRRGISPAASRPRPPHRPRRLRAHQEAAPGGFWRHPGIRRDHESSPEGHRC